MNSSIAIEGEMTVFTSHEIKTRLLDAMPPQGTLTVELGDVSEFDGAGLQLLIATSHEAVQRGGTVRLASPSPQVVAVLQLAGLSHYFNVTECETLEITP